MRTLGLCLAGGLVLFFTCHRATAAPDSDAKDGNAKELIVGKWEPADAKQKGRIEFTKDNKVKYSFSQFNIDGTYKFDETDDKAMTLTIAIKNPNGGKALSQTWKIKSISKENMVVTVKKQDMTFKRVQ